MNRLSPGGRVGPYEVVDALSAVSMGEVDRAGDTRLGRDVPLRVLPDEDHRVPHPRKQW